MGKTPLTVSDLLPGKHEVTVEGENGHRQHDADGGGGTDYRLDVPVYAGWASVLSPVQLDILLEGKLVGSTEIEKLTPRPGRHLELVNESLGYPAPSRSACGPRGPTSVSVVPKTPVTARRRRKAPSCRSTAREHGHATRQHRARSRSGRRSS